MDAGTAANLILAGMGLGGLAASGFLHWAIVHTLDKRYVSKEVCDERHAALPAVSGRPREAPAARPVRLVGAENEP